MSFLCGERELSKMMTFWIGIDDLSRTNGDMRGLPQFWQGNSYYLKIHCNLLHARSVQFRNNKYLPELISLC
jgi:hypothetical protein